MVIITNLRSKLCMVIDLLTRELRWFEHFHRLQQSKNKTNSHGKFSILTFCVENQIEKQSDGVTRIMKHWKILKEKSWLLITFFPKLPVRKNYEFHDIALFKSSHNQVHTWVWAHRLRTYLWILGSVCQFSTTITRWQTDSINIVSSMLIESQISSLL